MAFTEVTIDADGTTFTLVLPENFYWEDLTATNWEDSLVASSSLPLEWVDTTTFSTVSNTATTFTEVAISG
jgi:hypothetical protein|tara:strand:- start:165 stop:377 length:213 start_codon:yes stop_codon:yes gene_type:complete